MTEFGTYQGAFTIRRKTFDRKRSKIAMLECEGQEGKVCGCDCVNSRYIYV
jgi:hypothetical protein